MKNDVEKQYESIEKALKKVGFIMENIQKKGKKTVITISQADTSIKKSVQSENRNVNNNN